MFSIAAINDSDTGNEWNQPLAPTKEAQEFHLSQLYHDGLSRLQAKDYEKAREYLELVLKDSLVLNAEAGSSANSGHLLQLRFLALKNLALVFVQLGSSYHENALGCYLQAAEIDGKDFVVWNQLGTLSCSMGSLNIARWAFEQGLVCSPNNWNCMEKLLEVLIAIGDEVSCLSVSGHILTHWPSHSRALHVKNTIEDRETIPFAPRGIDKLVPKHTHLKFPEKRKASDENLVLSTTKRLKKIIEIQLFEVSWMALVRELLGILCPLLTNDLVSGADVDIPGDATLIVSLPSISANTSSFDKMSGSTGALVGSEINLGTAVPVKEKEGCEEQPQERRSSRLERLRSRKPESEMANKDLSKIVKQFLAPYIVDEIRTMNSQQATDVSSSETGSSVDRESVDVIEFVQSNSGNFGPHHFSELLLEKIASCCISYHDSMVKILELEKLIRPWGYKRTRECSLFLAELYYDIGSASFEESVACSFMTDASYHLCKVIESAAQNYPAHIGGFGTKSCCSQVDLYEKNQRRVINKSLSLCSDHSYWVRFFWLSSHLSRLEGDEERVQKELSMAVSLFLDTDVMTNHPGSISMHHCKMTKKLSIDRVLYEMHLIEVEHVLKKCAEMVEKNMHDKCISTLAPLLLSEKVVYFDSCEDGVKEGKRFLSVELSALDVLIKSAGLSSPMDIDVLLSSLKRKLQILLAGSGILVSSEDTCGIDSFTTSQLNENTWKHWGPLVAEAVKALSQSISKIKFLTNSEESSKNVPETLVGGIQSLLVVFMCSISNFCFTKRLTCSGVRESTEQLEQGYFVDAAVAFCKLQHLNQSVPIKSQAELILAIHDLLAEFGICCGRGDGDKEEEGTFLRLAIKHLLTLDMKLKSRINSVNSKQDINFSISKDDDHKMSSLLERSSFETSITETSSFSSDDKYRVPFDADKPETLSAITNIESNEVVDKGEMLTEDERDELELAIDSALDQCFYCLYGLNLRLDSSCEDDLVKHKNTSQGDYQTKEQCADVFQYILPYAKASSRSGLVKLRRALRAIRKHFPQPPDNMLSTNPIDKFLDDPELCEDKLSEHAASSVFLDTVMKDVFSENESTKSRLSMENSDPYIEVHRHLYYLLSQAEEMSASDKWAGFVLTKEGEDFVQQNAKLFKYDLLYNPKHFESWEGLSRIYDEEVDLLLNDGSKQINVLDWRKNNTLTQRVEASRRRSRRCLLMTLALAKETSQQAEIHQLLALVYYDGLQNVVPFYDQRLILPLKDATWTTFCQNALSHFKRAFKHKEDWSHAFYIGKLSEKLGHPHDLSLSYYAQAIALNPTAVDPFYRLHASRLKLLSKSGKKDEDTLKVVAVHCFAQSIQESVNNVFLGLLSESSDPTVHLVDGTSSSKVSKSNRIENVLKLLYEDCLSALETCVEGDLKHFHKARYMISQGLYRRGGPGDIERAKEELSFCFKSSRSSFTINMWEIDSTVKKGKRKNAGPSGNRRCLEVNLAESSRKFTTCIRKYILFYLKLLEETGDISMLERAYISLRADKRFSVCLEDLVPVAMGRCIKAVISCMRNCSSAENAEPFLEKLFNLFLDQVNLWPEICTLPELKGSELTDESLFGYLCRYIQLLETQVKVETLEMINEKIRKRLKNPKMANSHCAKIYRHVSASWCRSLVINMALITPPVQSRATANIPPSTSSGSLLESQHLLCVDLQSEELWSSAFEDSKHLKTLETKWSSLLSKIKNLIIRRVSDEEDLETANLLLRSAYSFYKDTSCALLPSGVNLYTVPPRLSSEPCIQPGLDGVDVIDTNTSRKLLLWAYTLSHGHFTSISNVIKFCEDYTRSRMRKGVGSSPSTNVQATASAEPGGNKEGAEAELHAPTATASQRLRSDKPEEKCSSPQQDNRNLN